MKNLRRARSYLLVCTGSDCRDDGAKALLKRAKQELRRLGLKREVKILKTRCTGNCKRAPVCGLIPENEWLERATPEALCALIEERLTTDPDR